MSEPTQLVIVVEGGIVQSVLSCGLPIRAVIVDYDVDGAAEGGTVLVPQLGAPQSPEEAAVWEILVDDAAPAHACALFALGAFTEPEEPERQAALDLA